MKRTVGVTLVVVSFIFLLSLVSCAKSGNSQSPLSDAVSVRSETSKNENYPEIMKKNDVNGDGKLMVLFVGNSYTISNDVSGKFMRIAKTQGIDLKEYIRTVGGYSLSKHLTELPNYPDIIKNSDIVVLQDFGGFGPDTVELVPKIQALFDEKVMLYYYPYIVPSEYYNLFHIENITFVPTGDIYKELLKVYSESTFIESNYNNELCSYIFANAIYSVIFNADCTDFPYKSIITKAYMPGETMEEKESKLMEIRKTIMKVINNQNNRDESDK